MGRVANDKALYAKPGTPLEFTFTAFSGNNSVDAASVLLQDQLKKIGFKVNLEVIEFQKMVEKLQGQTFDALTVFLAMTPANPDSIFSQMDVSGDIVKSGLNAGSWNNQEFTDLMKKARTLPGCDLEERKKLYFRVQEIVREELPWYFLNWSMVPQVYNKDLKNFDPRPFGALWNLELLFTPVAK
jgi:peptide/nickel transport system substrate-binding protein